MKKEKSEISERADKLNDGQMYTGFTYKGRKHRPLTAGALKFLQRIGSPLYTSDFEGYSEVDIIIEYLFATSADSEEMAYGIDNWKTVQFSFANDYTMKDLSDPIIVESMTRDIGNQTAASVEVKTTMGKSHKETVVTG
jgi:hypothetical protein